MGAPPSTHPQEGPEDPPAAAPAAGSSGSRKVAAPGFISFSVLVIGGGGSEWMIAVSDSHFVSVGLHKFARLDILSLLGINIVLGT